jgi:methanogenic corrinoid protein MtbC1
MPAVFPTLEPTFRTLILEGDRRGAQRYAVEVFEQHGVRFLYEEVVEPALRQVGELWSSGRITVADEHLATATAQTAVAALYPRFPWTSGGPHVVIGCVQGERHELGVRMVADLFSLDGWDERFLGADVPLEDLMRKIDAVEPKVVAISVTLPNHVAMARTTVSAVRRTFPLVKIIVGGSAPARLPDASESLGADAVVARAFDGVEVARAWK